MSSVSKPRLRSIIVSKNSCCSDNFLEGPGLNIWIESDDANKVTNCEDSWGRIVRLVPSQHFIMDVLT